MNWWIVLGMEVGGGGGSGSMARGLRLRITYDWLASCEKWNKRRMLWVFMAIRWLLSLRYMTRETIDVSTTASKTSTTEASNL